MAKTSDEFWTVERVRHLLHSVQENPMALNNPSLDTFEKAAFKLGVTNAECYRYYSLMHSKYLRQKKKKLDGKKLKNWIFLDDFLQIEANLRRIDTITTQVLPTDEFRNEVAHKQNVFLAKNVNNQQQVAKMAYDNVAFNSGSSEDDEKDFSTRSHISSSLPLNPRKRPLYSPSEKKSVFKKAGEYMVAELENMEPDKAQLLLNKTLKFFVEHRYDM